MENKININSMGLLNLFLATPQQIISRLLNKVQSGTATEWDVRAVGLLRDNCVKISVLYLYREGKAFNDIMSELSQAIKENNTEKEKIAKGMIEIWEELKKLTDIQITDMTIKEIQRNSFIMLGI